jgi:transcriptional regulator with XRE-family HTH domain
MNNIGYKIRKVREFKGLSQEYVAQKLNISQSAYSKIECGETKVDHDRIADISGILEVDPMDLHAFDENYIFNNCTQPGGKFNHFINQLPEKLMEQYEARIKQLEEENKFLKNLHYSNTKAS